MLRKISFALLHPKERQRAQSEVIQRPPSPLDFDDGDAFGREPAWQQMEALNLEPLVAPFLGPMRDMTITREGALHKTKKRPEQTMGAYVREEMARRPSAMLMQATSMLGVALLPVGKPVTTPTEEIANPFDGPSNPFLITPIPKRPGLRRNALSARGRRDLPLRVQALRRSHQQAFAEAIAQRIQEEAESWSRRPSEEEEEITFEPSALWRRRKRSSPETDELPELRLRMHGDEPPPDTLHLFTLTDAEGRASPYRLDMEMPVDRTPTPETEDPVPEPYLPYGAEIYMDEDGRSWI